MSFKKICHTLLFPHLTVCILLLPTATVWLVYSFLELSETSPVRTASYVAAFYTLTVWCLRVPKIIRRLKGFKSENRYIKKWTEDTRLRLNITLIGNVLWNGAYAVLQLGTGIYHRSAWFYSLSAYYASLAVMRFFILRHTIRNKPGENFRKELGYYRICGPIFLFMNFAISLMMLYMIRENRVMRHSEITCIAMAAYTFTTLTFAVINVIKYRKYNSPALSAAKAISLTAACVSMLTLENTMLTAFATEEMTAETRILFLGLSGGAVSVFIMTVAIYMTVHGNKMKLSEE